MKHLLIILAIFVLSCQPTDFQQDPKPKYIIMVLDENGTPTQTWRTIRYRAGSSAITFKTFEDNTEIVLHNQSVAIVTIKHP